ncbi:MAG: hypothetical protein ACRD9S_14825 [Pyrinomonadaceae bacterium]
MKKAPTTSRGRQANNDDPQAEYQFDYKQARPNRFAGQVSKERLVVILDKDVSEVFSTPESVNTALRALISAIPKPSKARKSA